MSLLYAILTTLIGLFLSPALLIAELINWRNMRQRLLFLPDISDVSAPPLVWFHAASLGEAVGMATVVNPFMKMYPSYRVAVSTMTTTGMAYVRQSIPGAHIFFLLPLDFPFLMRRLVTRLKPRALILLEGELWPSLLRAVYRTGCSIVLINGRMSDRSYPRYKWIEPLMRDMLLKLTAIGAQNPLDAERFMAFGVGAERVIVTGNVKFDSTVRKKPLRTGNELRLMLGLSEDIPVIVAGSPRPVEEELAVLHACARIQAHHPEARIIWAPRHLERLPHVEYMLTERGITWIRRSLLSGDTPVEQSVILLDTLGELSTLYAVADVAFVGATLVPLGGHNLLEPASFGVPVLFGPYTENVRSIAGALLLYGGGREVHDGAELASAFLHLLEHPEERQKMGHAAAEAVRSGDGALKRTMVLLKERILHEAGRGQ